MAREFWIVNNARVYSSLHFVILAHGIKPESKEETRVHVIEKAAADKLANSNLAFVEYFHAIERGEYKTNGREPRIRGFEQILIDRAMDALKDYRDKDET